MMKNKQRGNKKNMPNRKGSRPRFDDKFKDKIVDYFPRDSAKSDGLIFNQAPVVKNRDRSESREKKNFKQKKKAGEMRSMFADSSLYDEYDSDNEISGRKRMKPNNDEGFIDDLGGGSLGTSTNFVEYFSSNRSSFKSLTKMASFKYSEGSVIMAAVCDYGVGNKYLVVNLTRNKRAYISFSDIGEDGNNHVKHFQKGEYVVGIALGSTPKKVQLSLKPSLLNRELRFEDIQINQTQIISGYLKEQEDYGYMIDFCTEDKVLGFLYFPAIDILLHIGRPYLFSVTGKNEATNMIDCQIIHPSLMFDSNPLNYKQITNNGESGDINLETLASAGNRVSCIVKKVLENGVVVSFLNLFFGFVFQDHLSKPLTQYKANEKIEARIIATDWQNRHIHLSTLEFHLNLNLYNPELQIGDSYNSAKVVENLYGGSYLVELLNGQVPIRSFLHKTHLKENETGEIPQLHLGQTLEMGITIKDFNYFEHYPFVTTKDEVSSTLKLAWSNLKAGEVVSGTIAKILDAGTQKMRVIVSLNKFVSGIVNHMHLAEYSTKASIKGLKEKKEVKARILSVDKDKKIVNLSLKPSLLEHNINILDSYNCEFGKSYPGIIAGQHQQGLIIKFFNDITGFLPFSDIEAAGVRKEELMIGQTIRPYVRFIDAENNKIGLTLSNKTSESHKKIENPLDSVENQNPQVTDIKETSLIEGDIYEYKVLRKKSVGLDNYLFLKSTRTVSSQGEYLEHVALLPKAHLSDFPNHIEKLFKHYLKDQNARIQAKIISFIPNNNVFVSIKPVFLKSELPRTLDEVIEKHYYFGFVDSSFQSGIKISLSGTVQGVLSSNKLPEDMQENFSVHFPVGKTVKVLINKVKVDQGKLYFEYPEAGKETFEMNSEDYLFQDYLNEEYLTTKERFVNNPSIWENYRIGNYIKVKVDMIKDYGIVAKLPEGLVGLLMRTNLINEIEDYQPGQYLVVRVLDLDYEKKLINLMEESQLEEKYDSKLKNRKSYNREKIIKYGIHKSKKSILSGTILFVEENYVIAKLSKFPKVLAIIQCKKINDVFESYKKFDKESIIKFKPLNYQNFVSADLEVDHIESLSKQQSALIGTIYTGKKQEDKGHPEGQLSDAWLKKNLKVGAIVSGTVTKLSNNNIFLSLSKAMQAKNFIQLFRFGRVHKSQFDYDGKSRVSDFEKYKPGDHIKCKVLSIRKTDHLYIDLTALKSQLDMPEDDLNQDFILSEVTQEHVGKKYRAVVKSISVKSLNPLYVELSNQVVGQSNAFDGIISPNDKNVQDKIQKLNNLGDYYQVGDVIEVWIKNIAKKTNENKELVSAEISLYDPNEFKQISQIKSEISITTEEDEKNNYKVGQLVVCRVSKLLKKGVRVQFGREEFGFVDITELFDEFYAYPLRKIEPKLNTFVMGRIIAFSSSEDTDDKKGGNEIFVSLRESILNSGNWKVIEPVGTTLQFKRKLGHQEEAGDLRSRIYKLGVVSVKPNQIFVGYVSQTNDKGCFVKIAFNLSARASHKDLSDMVLLNPSATFFENRLVIGRVLSIREDGKINITLKENAVKFGHILEDSKLRNGLVVKAYVSGYNKNSAILSIPGCKYTATLKPEEVNLEGKSIEKALPVGTEFLTKIKSIEKNANPWRIRVTCRISEEEVYKLKDESNRFEVDRSSVQRIIDLYDSIKTICKEYDQMGDKSAINPGLIEKLREKEEKNEDNDINHQENEMVEESEEYINQEGEEEKENLKENFPYMLDEEEENEGEENPDEIVEEQSVVSEEDQVDDMEFLLSSKSVGKKKKELERMKVEAEIRERERKLLDDNQKQLTSSDDYEKLILKNPNSSYVWIQYVAFKYEKDGIEKARFLMERALRTIMFRSDNEKLNLWTAFLNLEFNFGTEETIMKVFERAKAANNPKKVYMKLIDLYRNSEKWDMVEELCKAMVKKHKHSSKAWISYMSNMLEVIKGRGQQNSDLSPIITRALQCLHKRKHLKILSAHGMLLFKKNELERGRTVFEAVLTNYPKRTDIWNIYIDMEIKYGTRESVRNLMERCISLQLSPKKMKFFFKRYLKFEIEHGTSDRVEKVKNKATEYVSKITEQEAIQEDNNEEGNIEEDDEIDQE